MLPLQHQCTYKTYILGNCVAHSNGEKQAIKINRRTITQYKHEENPQCTIKPKRTESVIVGIEELIDRLG